MHVIRRQDNSQNFFAQKLCDQAINTQKHNNGRCLSKPYLTDKLPPLADYFTPDEATKFDNFVTRQFVKGEIVYVKSICGPIIKTTVVENHKYGFVGTIDEEDCKRLFLAGTPEYPPNYKSMFFEHAITTKENYNNEDKTKHIVRIQKKLRKNRNN